MNKPKEPAETFHTISVSHGGSVTIDPKTGKSMPTPEPEAKPVVTADPIKPMAPQEPTVETKKVK